MKIDSEKEKLLKKRRDFIQKTSFLFGALGISNALSIEIRDGLACKLFETAEADNTPVKRMIFIGVRDGASLLGFGVNSKFKSLTRATFPNVPFSGNQFIPTSTSLMLTPSSQLLLSHANNIAIIPGVQSQGGHTSLFNFWEGGQGKGQTSPIILLAEKNTSGSAIAGVHFSQNNANQVTHVTNGKQGLLNRRLNDFKSTFKKPTLALADNEVRAVLDLSTKLSRRQALKMSKIIRNPNIVINEKNKASELILTDYSSQLNINDMPTQITGG